jgi:putative membrane-bound dehydrogenase-like protein
MKSLTFLLVAAPWLYIPSWASAAQPTAADDRLIIELVAREPDIVTPTGLAVDERGRIWVIENHTHQRPARYTGPTSDRIRIFDDFGADGKARRTTTWAEGFRDTMGISLGKNGDVFLATRSAIYLLHDVQGKGQADEKLVLARLDTTATYPHNGLSGFAIDALGDIYIGLGENFGAPYKLIGRDKTTLTGGGEGGSIYRMKPDGSGLTRIATGFWNPFAMTFDRWGRLFAVDNDPDARGPCRLLHIIQDGDYGYRFKYGRKGIHPFQSWNGELPGTLPMVAGTAEAPSGIVAYESSGLPDEYRGQLLVTSWGDHVIEQFQLEPRGASFGAKKKIVVRGGEDFRPVGIALAPDGSLVVSDWVDKSYPVHGKGRIWRIRAKDRAADKSLLLSEIDKQETTRLKVLLSHPRREVRLAAGEIVAGREQLPGYQLLPVLKDDPNPLARLHALWALAGRSPREAQPVLAVALADPAPEVRAEAAALSSRLYTRGEFDKLQPLLTKLALTDATPAVRLQAVLARGKIWDFYEQIPILPLLGDEDPFIVSTALSVFAKTPISKMDVSVVSTGLPPRQRLGLLLAIRRNGGPLMEAPLRSFLRDPDPAIRRAAIQWVAEEGLNEHAQLLDDAATMLPVSRQLIEAWLAAKELLANPGPLRNPNSEPGGEAFVIKYFNDTTQPAALRAFALAMLRPDHPKLKLADLVSLAKDARAPLRAEAVKTLAWRANAAAQQTLRELAADLSLPLYMRSDAVLGLALSAPTDAKTVQLLVKLATEKPLAADALRSLRGALTPADAAFLGPWWQALKDDATLTADNREALAEQALLTRSQTAEIKLTTPRPDSVAGWRNLLLQTKGNREAGERVFFHSKGPRCFACHMIDGRGEAVGPDLSRIGAAMNREKLIESILEPSKEIAPAFVTWLITTRDGKQHTGVIVSEGFDSTLTVADSQGKRTVLQITDIEDRVAQKTSIMPADLHGQMTRREFADLLVFLEGRK